MTPKDRIFSFLETIIQAVKFHGLWFGMVFFYNALKARFLLKPGAGVFKLFGYTIQFKHKDSIINTLFELFGQNVYYFRSKEDAPFIVDAGANIGDSVLYFKWLYPSARILAFEPNTEAYELLQNNIRANGLTDVTTYKKALGKDEGETYLDGLDDGTYLAGTIAKTAALHTTDVSSTFTRERVAMVRLSENELVKAAPRIDLLKLDIEGAECDVLEDMAKMLEKVYNVVFEYHFVADIQKNSLDKLVNLLKHAGFHVGVQGLYRKDDNVPNPYVFLIYANREQG